MKYMNFCANPNDIKVALFVHKNEFSRTNIVRNLLSLFPEKYRNNIVVLTCDPEINIASLQVQLHQLPSDCVITFSDAGIYKKITGHKTLPKAVGKLSLALNNKHIQYFNYSSKALYMYANLETNRKCVNHIVYLLDNNDYLQTQVDRKLLVPKSREEAIKAFKYLLANDYLGNPKTIGSDIETTSLKFYKAELVSISFAVDEVRGFTFHVKYTPWDMLKPLLTKFFKKFKGRIAWHGGSYDIKVLAHLLFKGDSRELFRTFEDTLFLHYICTNSPERFPRDLGTLTSDLLGEYKLSKAEITDMMNVDPEKVCKYNLDDARGTWWLYKQLRHKIHSEYLYDKFKKWQWALTQAELVGIPFSYKRMLEVDKILSETLTKANTRLMGNKYVLKAMEKIREVELNKRNSKRVKPLEIWELPLSFNPNSSPQLSILFFDILGFKPIRTTKKGNAAVDKKTIKALSVQTKDPEIIEMFDLLNTISDASKMQGTFIKALKEHSFERDGHHYLHGSYNMAKVVSGRLSSSDPNLQNLPSGSTLSKLFKSIFIAPKGWFWGGADFASLEERINTILTKDPAKRAVYLHGYDGHSYRAFYYFPKELEAIHIKATKAKTIEEHVAIVNSIEHLFKEYRTKGKSPTFLLQYLGTAIGLVNTCGFTEEEANKIYNNYYELYKVSAEWLNKELEKVAEQGYAEVAYGLRVYCYGITKALLNVRRTPHQIQEFIRTLGNAIGGQSYGQLTVDAAYKFLKRVYDAGLQDRVFFIATIHDANYLLWFGDKELTAWVNRNLIECMMDTSEHPQLQGDIPLPANLDIHLPSWDKPVTLYSHTMTGNEISRLLSFNLLTQGKAYAIRRTNKSDFRLSSR